jgi:Holliday junction resolvase
MSQYSRGRDFEWKVRDDLEENGYEVVRAAGSKGSTKIDEIAIKPGQMLFVQAKRDGNLPPAEWDRLVEVAAWVDALPILAANGIRGRGVTYLHLLGPKRPGLHMKNQPVEVFHLDHIAAALTAPQSGVHLSVRGAGRPNASADESEGFQAAVPREDA